MRILMINTSSGGGGAALAASRLAVALRKCGHEVRLMAAQRQDGSALVDTPWGDGGLREKLSRLPFLAERLAVWTAIGFRRRGLWEIDMGAAGFDVCRTEAFSRADVVHLHWINQGMLSLGGIKKIVGSGKPVVWTMHDLWPATAICHYARSCRGFERGCHSCPLLPRWMPGDTAGRVFARKDAAYRQGHIRFVACSQWLAGEAMRSPLTRHGSVASIPNPIDTDAFCPAPKDEARRSLGLPADKKILLWAAQKVTDPRKGMRLLVKALATLAERYPGEARQMAVAILGGKAEEAARAFPIDAIPIGFLAGQQAVANAYRAADAFVLPSTEDNLPNTIMEAMACGVPSIGYRIGGVPEMIAHRRTGYVAMPCDTDDLAEGIRHVLFDIEAATYGNVAREKALSLYSEAAVAARFTSLYTQATDEKR